MRISINLASRPFVELRPLFARLRLMIALLALAAVGLGVGLYFVGARARAAQARMDDLKRQTEAFQQERAVNEARMRRPENRAVLERAQFLNGVFTQKSFSWTSVMMDLERVLPAGVQVTSIEPAVTADGEVSIQLRVSGPRELSVDLVRNLEHSQRFVQPRLANETAQTQEGGRVLPVAQAGLPGVQFDILSGYKPLPEAKKPVEMKTADAKGPDTKAAGPKTVSAKAKTAGARAVSAKTPDATSAAAKGGVR
jgi:type IV pilus assembly protein PilN